MVRERRNVGFLNMSYASWLERQNELAHKALELIQKFKFKVVVIEEERTPSFVRLYIKETKVDFRIKEVKSQFARSVWLCKRKDFNLKDNYLVYQSKEERWVIVSGRQAEARGEIRDSDYKEGVKFLVVPMEAFGSALAFFKRMKSRYEAQLQRRMTDWT